MKYLAASLAVACATTNVGAAPPPNPHVVHLREVLQQYHPGSAPSPRALSASERAELRRQLLEQAAPSIPPKRQGKR
ncbi:hypothetical protein [Ramlibacter pallidus]|uniref:DUF4148 domain-containing protein n=1 Tax=Ramlibacter pallidus TaxID=2780087 RepID=A0ABR9S338_9BURK|nr:hypothetical protein [Ramlibacter pallidus]MBE7367893.1 hypothetical protein [Ramlibacter pallidus]